MMAASGLEPEQQPDCADAAHSSASCSPVCRRCGPTLRLAQDTQPPVNSGNSKRLDLLLLAWHTPKACTPHIQKASAGRRQEAAARHPFPGRRQIQHHSPLPRLQTQTNLGPQIPHPKALLASVTSC
jgi:hypothetical protein